MLRSVQLRTLGGELFGITLSQVLTTVQIAFYASTATVAVLSYRTAKRTLFQPLRTEVFKNQVTDLSQVLKLFSGKKEVKLRDEFAFSALIRANTAKMFDSYALFAFDYERPKESREYRIELCPISLVDPAALRVDESFLRPDAQRSPVKPEKWDYKHTDISLPREYTDKHDEVQLILDSPLLPSPVGELLESYLEVINQNTIQIRDTIVECSKDMPDKYPTLEDLQRSRTSWVTNEVNRKFRHLEPEANKINAYVRTYFDSDNLLPKRKDANRIPGKRWWPTRWFGRSPLADVSADSDEAGARL